MTDSDARESLKMICGLDGLTGLFGGRISCCTCNTLVKCTEEGMNGDTLNLELCLHSLICTD